jgi:predicted DNA-binding transcriptional regulator AlpA
MDALDDGVAADESDANPILTEAEVSRLTRLSTRTLQRLSEDGRGPRRIRLTERRIGYWKADVLAWLNSRTSKFKHAA